MTERTDISMSTQTVPVPLPAARTTAEAIAKAIRADILAGVYGSGQKLRQVEIAELYGVSTTPVREALKILEKQSLVRASAQRGATVLVPTVEDLNEHYEIRAALESLAVEHAAMRFQPSDGPRLRALLAEMQACDDPDRYVELNHNFHMAVYALSGRRRLVEMIEELRMATQAYIRLGSEEVAPAGHSEQEHDDIIAALEANDPALATLVTRQHLQGTVSSVAPQLSRADGAHSINE